MDKVFVYVFVFKRRRMTFEKAKEFNGPVGKAVGSEVLKYVCYKWKLDEPHIGHPGSSHNNYRCICPFSQQDSPSWLSPSVPTVSGTDYSAYLMQSFPGGGYFKSVFQLLLRFPLSCKRLFLFTH